MVSLATILEEAEESLFEAIEDSNATISKKHLPSINGMHFQLRQLFENLISNSIKFRKPDVDPVISIEAKLITGKDIYPSLPTNNARYFNITYRDNGIGFNSNYSNKIFDLFQRLEVKEKQHGTGMGLTICRKIVQNHDGFIKAFSEENHGSRFEIYLPA
jgi:signal transduction histidine kinase